MSVRTSKQAARIVQAVHGKREAKDPPFEVELAQALREAYSPGAASELYGRFANGEGMVDALMRRAIVRASARQCGSGLRVGPGACFRHMDTFEFGDGVFIGAQANIQGRHDGHLRIGSQSWIGPQAFLDARNLVIGEHVGWGPGARVLGSEHTGLPIDIPIIGTDLTIREVTIGDWADIGTNATILPGVTVGKGAIIGAGSVVTSDVEPFAVVAGVPARFLRWRTNDDLIRAREEENLDA